MPGDICLNKPHGGRKSLVVAIIAMISSLLPVLLVGSLAIHMRRTLGFGSEVLGAVVALFFLASAVSSPVVGRVIKKTGLNAALRWGSIGTSVACLGLAGAISVWTLIPFVLIGGLAHAVVRIAAIASLAQQIPASRQGLAFGIAQATAPGGMMLAGLAIPGVALILGWRWAFLLAGSLAAGFSVSVSCGEPSGDACVKHPSPPETALPPLLLLAATMGFGAASSTALLAFFVDSSVRMTGLTLGEAGSLMVLGSFAGLSVQVLAGWVADDKGTERLLTLATMLVVAALGYLLLATGSSSLIIAATVLCFGAGWGWPGLFALTVVTHNPAAPVAATGITQAGGYVGAAGGPLLIGIVSSEWSYSVAWSVTSALMLVAALCAMCARAVLRRQITRRFVL